ncbi:MAG: DUF3467 domain-containing protein [Planctomycetota bacterium]
MAKTDKPAAKPAEGAPAAPAAKRAEVTFDDSKTIACYANFCRVTGTPEELIIDFGLNNQPMGVPTESIPISQRIIVNFFTAKRLLGALSMSIQRHEAAFGVLETDVQKRVQPGVRAAAGAPPAGAPPQKS